ncbi:MAG: hypothetical protein KAI43_01070 [Candidatus Aureabacteria bacterium]|nr:hypothetical protein [Candidatus Auribacterota bacterium]
MKDYSSYITDKEKEHEALCKRCGACCGALNDPCIHLQKDKQGKYFCDTYDNRTREHNTISGETFRCVDIRSIIYKEWKGKENCEYFLKLKEPSIDHSP